MNIWYILQWFGIFFPALVSRTEKNLATLVQRIYVIAHVEKKRQKRFQKRIPCFCELNFFNKLRIKLLRPSFNPRKSTTQCCQMGYFQTKNPNVGLFWRALDWKILIYFIAIGNILWTFGIFYDHLVHFVFILVHFVRFWYLATRKSGNPARPPT
jgi:hypothetical protein